MKKSIYIVLAAMFFTVSLNAQSDNSDNNTTSNSKKEIKLEAKQAKSIQKINNGEDLRIKPVSKSMIKSDARLEEKKTESPKK